MKLRSFNSVIFLICAFFICQMTLDATQIKATFFEIPEGKRHQINFLGTPVIATSGKIVNLSWKDSTGGKALALKCLQERDMRGGLRIQFADAVTPTHYASIEKFASLDGKVVIEVQASDKGLIEGEDRNSLAEELERMNADHRWGNVLDGGKFKYEITPTHYSIEYQQNFETGISFIRKVIDHSDERALCLKFTGHGVAEKEFDQFVSSLRLAE